MKKKRERIESKKGKEKGNSGKDGRNKEKVETKKRRRRRRRQKKYKKKKNRRRRRKKKKKIG